MYMHINMYIYIYVNNKGFDGLIAERDGKEGVDMGGIYIYIYIYI
jgi:hypothetical protein